MVIGPAPARDAVGRPYRVLVPVGGDDPAGQAALVDLAVDLVGDESPAEVVLSQLSPQAELADDGLGESLADIATSLDGLRALGERVDERGVRAAVHHQASADPAGGWARQVAELGADVVVLGAGDPWTADLVARLAAETRADVVVATVPTASGAAPGRPTAGPVLVAAGKGRHGAAAVELAVRAARGRAAAVVLLGAGDDGRGARRRLGHLAEQVAALGLAVRVAAADDPANADAIREGTLCVVAADVTARVAGIPTGIGRCVVRAADGVRRRGLADVFAGRPAPGPDGRRTPRAHGPIIDGSPPVSPSAG